MPALVGPCHRRRRVGVSRRWPVGRGRLLRRVRVGRGREGWGRRCGAGRRRRARTVTTATAAARRAAAPIPRATHGTPLSSESSAADAAGSAFSLAAVPSSASVDDGSSVDGGTEAAAARSGKGYSSAGPGSPGFFSAMRGLTMPYPTASVRSSPLSGFPAVFSMTRSTWWLVQSGCWDQMRAAEAEARAVAELVPSPPLQTWVPARQALTMSLPGAVKSTWGPLWEELRTLPSLSTAPTPTTPGVAAGYSSRLDASPLLPAAAKISLPLSMAYRTAEASCGVPTFSCQACSGCPWRC